MANRPGKQRHHFLLDAVDASGNPVNPDEPCDVGALPAVIPLPRSQQAVGRQVRIFMVNNTDYPEEVPSLTQEQEDLADTLTQVGADPHIQRVHGVRAGGGDDLSDAPPNQRLTRRSWTPWS